MTTAGPNAAGTGANDTGVGTIAWTSPTNIYTDDGVVAQTQKSGSGIAYSNYLWATNFGFSIPSGATINGVAVSIQRYGSSTGATKRMIDNIVSLIKGGSVVGSNYASATTWPASDTAASYGGVSDLWGTSLTDSEVNASNFGVALSAKFNYTAGKGFLRGYVDFISITVTYTAGSGVAIPVMMTQYRQRRA